jgi:heat shock protein HslJ
MTRHLALFCAVCLLAGCTKVPKPNLAAPPKPQPVKTQVWTLNLSVPPITFQYTDGRVAGNSGCNQYSGPFTQGANGAITIGALISTRRACLSDFAQVEETQFLARLQAATALRREANQLTIDYRNGNDIGSLEFTLNAQ